MVGAGGEVVGQSGGDRLGRTVQNQVVDQPIAPVACDVCLVVAQPQQIVDIVGASQVGITDEDAATPSSLGRVRIDDHRVLGGEHSARVEQAAGFLGVAWHRQVGVSSGCAVGGKAQRSRPERGEDATVTGMSFV